MKNGHEILQGIHYWYHNDVYHRDDGPAVLYPDGSESWYINGELHREDGPALTFADRKDPSWYLNGIRVPCSSQEEFERFLRLKAFW